MNKRRKTIALVSIFFVCLGLVSWFLIRQNSDHPLLELDKSAQEYKSKIKKPEDWAKDSISFPAFKEVTVVEGSDKTYMALENPSFNNANIQFSLKMSDEQTPFYESGLVEPGKAITEVPLPKNLPVGEHKVTLMMKAYAPNDEKTKLNGANVDFTLRVLEKGE